MATGGVSVWMSAHIFFALTSQPLILDSPAAVIQIIPALFLFASIYFLTNSWLIAAAIGLDTGRSVFSVWKGAFVLLSLNYISGASLAALLLPFIESSGLGTISLIAPLMVLAYVTFRTAMGRIADTNTHLSELNKLYLSTIARIIRKGSDFGSQDGVIVSRTKDRTLPLSSAGHVGRKIGRMARCERPAGQLRRGRSREAR